MVLIVSGDEGKETMSIGSKACPDCGRMFNWLQRAVGEYKTHRRKCAEAHGGKGHIPYSTGCRGCPAGCYDRAEEGEKDG